LKLSGNDGAKSILSLGYKSGSKALLAFDSDFEDVSYLSFYKNKPDERMCSMGYYPIIDSTTPENGVDI
jgi:hypothetical protein